MVVGEQPRLGLLERVDVAAVVAQDRTCGLHVAHARELQSEVDSVGFVLGLELRDLLVVLCDCLFPVGATHLWLILRRLLLPEVFLGLRLFLRLVAMCITCHVGLPLSLADSTRRPAPDSFGYRLSARHKVTPLSEFFVLNSTQMCTRCS